jgi:3-dehydroquinate synthase
MGMRRLLRDNQPLLPPGEPITTSSLRRRAYSIQVVPDERAGLEILRATIDRRAAMILTDHTVAALHGTRIASGLSGRGPRLDMITIESGERSKSLETACYIMDELARSQLGRRDILIAVGGGVVIDTAGWVASSYMRGIPYINVPTTLLAQVDAAIGGKVAVDHATAKNLIGAFYEPQAVVSCVSYLSTLDPRHIRAGMAEAIKAAVIASPELFDYIERHLSSILALDPECVRRLVHGASVIKCRLVERDPYEADLCRALNFGHAIAHAIETATGYGPVLHGEAVSVGMAVDLTIAVTRGLLSRATAERVFCVLAAADLPVALEDLRCLPPTEQVIAGLAKVRQIRDGSLRFVLPTDLGSVVIADDVTEGEIAAALAEPAQVWSGSALMR